MAGSGIEPGATPGAYPRRGGGDRDRDRAPLRITRSGGALRRALGRHADVDRAVPSRRPEPARADEPPRPVRRSGRRNGAARPRPHPLRRRARHLHGAVGRHAVGDRGPVPHRPWQPGAGERPAAARPSDLGHDASHPGSCPGSRPSPAPPQPNARPQAHGRGLAGPLPRPPRRHADGHRSAGSASACTASRAQTAFASTPCSSRGRGCASRRTPRAPSPPPPPPPRRRPGRSAGRSTTGAPTTASTRTSSGPSPGRSRAGTPTPSRPPAHGASCR